MIAQQLIKKYNLAADSYYTKSPYNKKYFFEKAEEGLKIELSEDKLFSKWESRIPDGWYGFSIGFPAPLVWYKAIDEFLDYVKLQNPDFQVLRIKTKYGSIRIYLNNVSESIQKEVDQLEAVLSDKYLIW